MLKSLFSAAIDLKALKLPQKGFDWPLAATPVSSPEYANLIVFFCEGFGAVWNLPVSLHSSLVGEAEP